MSQVARMLLQVGFCAVAAGCAALPATPRLNRPQAIGEISSIPVRELDGTLKFSLVAGAYVQAAIYLAEHSKKEIAPDAPKPAGSGYIFELVRDGHVVDDFILWPGEIWLHGRRWAIEDKNVEERVRLLWNLR